MVSPGYIGSIFRGQNRRTIVFISQLLLTLGRSLLFTLKGTILDTPSKTTAANETEQDETSSFMKCVTPAVEQFPQALMGKSTRQKVTNNEGLLVLRRF